MLVVEVFKVPGEPFFIVCLNSSSVFSSVIRPPNLRRFLLKSSELLCRISRGCYLGEVLFPFPLPGFLPRVELFALCFVQTIFRFVPFLLDLPWRSASWVSPMKSNRPDEFLLISDIYSFVARK